MSKSGRIVTYWPLYGVAKMIGAITLIMLGVELDMFEKVDISTMNIPDEYLPYMLVSAIVLGAIFGRAYSLKQYRKGADIENGEKEDKRYLFCTIVSMVLGVAVGMYGAIPVTDAIFIGAGLWAYTAVAGILSAISGIMLNYSFQYGVREMIIKTAETAKKLQDAVKEASEKLE